MNHATKWILALCMAMLCGQVANAAELTVTNVAKVGADGVQFGITWSDSWRASWSEAGTKLTNWDAAWIFVKVRRKGDAGWSHATLSPKDADHLAPKGARIDVGMTSKKAMGVFLYRSDDGKGTFVNKGVKLKCLDKIDDVDLDVHAIEMVYVPQGAFYVGTNGKPGGSFTDGAWKKGDAIIPFKITSEAELKIAPEAGCLYGDGGVGAAHQIGPAGKLSAEFPKGYGAIYCMKYGANQGQYAAFLNQLTPAQASLRFPTFPAHRASTGHTIKKTPEGYVASKPGRACNWVSWDDIAAYIDWAGLRPMSELEYEKACRGPLKPITDEYAWGSAELPCPHEECKNTQVMCAKLDWPWILDPTVTPPVPMPQAICGAEGRVKSGATYWGIAAMSGHLRERTVTVGHEAGRVFTGRCGDGAVTDDALANVPGWPGPMATWEEGQRFPTTGVGFRGGPWYTDKARLRVSDRYMSSVMRTGRDVSYGFRAVRQAPVATTSPPVAKDATALMIYGVSIGENKAVVVKFHEQDGKPILEVVQSEPLGTQAGAITHHPDHNLLYIATQEGRGFVYAVNDDGGMKKVRETPFKSGYCFLSLDRSGRYLLGVSYESGNCDVYRLDAEGLPEKLVDSRNEKKTKAHSVGVSSDNRSVYVPYVKEENALYQYRFDPETGKLSPGAPPNIEIPDAVGPRHLALHPIKPYVYFSNEQQLGVSAYKIGPKGGLEPLQICAALETPPAEGMAASGIVITPDGRFLYVGVRGFGKPLNAVFGYEIGEDGRLKSLGMTATDSIPWALGMSPHGDHLFVTSSKQGSLAAYAVDNQGGLKKEASVKIGERFWDILVLGDASE